MKELKLHFPVYTLAYCTVPILVLFSTLLDFPAYLLSFLDGFQGFTGLDAAADQHFII